MNEKSSITNGGIPPFANGGMFHIVTDEGDIPIDGGAPGPI